MYLPINGNQELTEKNIMRCIVESNSKKPLYLVIGKLDAAIIFITQMVPALVSIALRHSF